jgi:DNA-binding transcriptional ArsR family regulator
MPNDVPPLAPLSKAAAARIRRQAEQVIPLLKLIDSPTRVRVVVLLAEGERNVGSLCEELTMSYAVVSNHIAILRVSGVVTPRRERQYSFYSLTPTGETLAAVARALMPPPLAAPPDPTG